MPQRRQRRATGGRDAGRSSVGQARSSVRVVASETARRAGPVLEFIARSGFELAIIAASESYRNSVSVILGRVVAGVPPPASQG
jgi:hypothetical protein